MLKRESACQEVEDPCWRGLVSSGGLPCWVCTATGQIALDPPPTPQDCSGGLFCDEPVSIFDENRKQEREKENKYECQLYVHCPILMLSLSDVY